VDHARTFDAGKGGRRIAALLPPWSPPAVAATTAVAGAAALFVILVVVGLLLTDVLSPGPVARGDAGVSAWLAARRTAALDLWTDVGSILAGTGSILIVAGVSVAILALQRMWHEAGFILIALVVEFTVFLTATLVVDRPRPRVGALDPMPVTSSYPSGHAAAAIALYAGLAIVLSSHVRSVAIRVAVWTIGVAVPTLVATSRVYRGMHHTTDVAASILLGAGVLVVALFAIRAADSAAHARRATRTGAIPVASTPEEVRA
jgi:membrane-associated phospholipid phosphatase